MNTKWLIWSLEHEAWWMPNCDGYTVFRKRAGIYSYEEAVAIVNGANQSNSDRPYEAMIEYVETESSRNKS